MLGDTWGDGGKDPASPSWTQLSLTTPNVRVPFSFKHRYGLLFSGQNEGAKQRNLHPGFRGEDV